MQLYAMMRNGEMKIVNESGNEVDLNAISQNPTLHPIAPLPVPVVPAKLLFSDFISEYLLMQKHQVRQNTYEIYKYTAETHIIPYFKKLDLAVQEVNTLHLQHYFNVKLDEGLSPATLKKHFTIINGTLSFAMYNMQMILYNPAERVKRPPVQRKKFSYLNDKQIQKLLTEIKGHPLESAVILASHYGLRRSEVLGLRWSAIDFSSNTITIKRTVVRTSMSCWDHEMTKTSDSYRTMPLMKDIKQYLQNLYIIQKNDQIKHRGNYIVNDVICKKVNGEPFRPDYVTWAFTKVIQQSELPYVRFHDLRHSAASLMINAGYELLSISYWLGHNDVNTTKRYAHLEYHSKEKLADFMNDELKLSVLYGLDTPNER